MDIALDLSFWSMMYWDAIKKKYIEKHDWEKFYESIAKLHVNKIITKLTGAYYDLKTKKSTVNMDQGLLVICKGLRELLLRLDGGFHWYDPRVSHIEQANTLAEKWYLANPKTLWIDIEQIAPGIDKKQYAVKALTFVQDMERKLNVLPGIYTAKWFWDVFIDGKSIQNDIKRYPLWVAHYTTAPKPYMPKYGWIDWAGWQYSDRLPVEGLVSKGTDVSRFKPGYL